ncbi:f9475de9-8f0e-41d3-993f-d28293b1ffa5 [Sclerotinia trifoliorum]|uniref:F9475de9-8f0e-41d3-993f-d28293b1ffa5 n=1 Tax=Sclerotinia trifoliorum TaxID=28548 RepID=A0A8H2W2S2_9HELO|nr:f9475de9-8f0e-41d3-993f-d28293b1ffa5 [Sclerotinia trifoliorum]
MSTTLPLPRLMDDAAHTDSRESQISYSKDDSSTNDSIYRHRWQRSDIENGYADANGHGNTNTNNSDNGGSAGSEALVVKDDHGVGEVDQQPDTREKAAAKVTVRDRIGCLRWTWFTLTMATGGIANVLHSIPYRSNWLQILGEVVFLLNLAFFIMICVLMSLRFKWKPGSFSKSFLSPSESLYIPACMISVGTILVTMCQYGIPKTGVWFQTTMHVCFWVYCTLSVLASSGLYLLLWSTQEFPISNMTPLWTFPAYPLLLTGPIASNLISTLPDASAAARMNSPAIAFGAICFQGIGFLLSLMVYSAFLYRLMTKKLPQETTRPGMFVSVGPSGFTVTAIVGLASSVRTTILPDGYMGNTDGPFILYLMGNFAGLFIWGLCLWFCLISMGAHWQVLQPNHPEHHISADMTWNSFIFPNTALATATIQIGTAFGSNVIRIIGTVISVILVVVWLGVLSMLIRALFLKRLLMPDQLDGAASQRKKWTTKVKKVKGRNQSRIAR